MESSLVAHKQFWDMQHLTNNLPHLSNCSLSDVQAGLSLSEYLDNGPVRILEFGVGTGRCTRELAAKGHLVTALDISRSALMHVEEVCDDVYSVEEIENLPTRYFDLVICANVVQHVPTRLLISEFEEAFRALKEGGVFAVHFVSLFGTQDAGDVETPPGNLPCFPRSPEFIIEMFLRWGGRVKHRLTRPVVRRNMDSTTLLHIKKERDEIFS